jgi:hypothetical protein
MKNLILESEPLVVFSPDVDFNQAYAELEIQLIGNLNLSVIDSASGRPVSHALISIDSIGKTAVCGACGKVSLHDLNSGKYLLDIISPGFIAQTISLSIHTTGTYELEVKMISNI